MNTVMFFPAGDGASDGEASAPGNRITSMSSSPSISYASRV